MQGSIFLILTFTVTMVFAIDAMADIKLENPECRTVILSDDGTWHYVKTPEARTLKDKTHKDKTHKDKTHKVKTTKAIAEKVYHPVDLNDLKQSDKKTDFLQKNPAIQTTGIVVVIIDSYFLKQDLDDETPIEINLDHIPKGRVDRLEKSCEKGCKITLYGHPQIDDEGYRTLIAEQIEFVNAN